MMKRFSLMALLLATGLVAGIVLSGTGENREEVLARPGAAPVVEQAAATPTAPATAIAGPDFTRVAAQTVKAVTNISSIQVGRRRQASPFTNDPFFQYFFGDQGEMFGQPRAESSLGSGEGETEVTVTVGDYRDVRAKIIGVDSWTDLALLKIEVTGLPVIPYGDSSKLKVAEWVMAVGSPFSLSQTVTLGVVSALGRANVGITQYEDFIQTDAAINPGNSGGALINSRAELVGINTAIFSQSGGYQGIGFAVPSNLVRRVVGDLMKFGRVRRGSIGYVEVMPLTSRLADELRAPKSDGIVVNQMARASAAYKAGLQPGDIIVSVNGLAIADASQFVRLISDSAIGSTVRVEVLRDGQRSTLRIPVEAQQDRPQRRR